MKSYQLYYLASLGFVIASVCYLISGAYPISFMFFGLAVLYYVLGNNKR